MILIDENIYLRSWQLKDAQILSSLANNYKIAKNLSDNYPFPYTLDDAKKYLKEVQNQKPYYIFAIEYKGKLAGSFGFFFHKDIWKKNVELGFWLAEKYWKKGIMTKIVNSMICFAFENFNINTVFAKVFENNTGSKKVCEKTGMTKEAVLKNFIYKNEKYYDEIIYTIQRNHPYKNYLEIFNKTKYYYKQFNNLNEIFINKKNPKIDSQLKINKGWALITAHNPLPLLLSENENASRNRLLEKDLKNFNFSFCHGFSILEDWKETGFLIKNISLAEACKLGKKYKQKAIIYASKNMPADLIFLM